MRSRDPVLCRVAAVRLRALLRRTAPSRIADARGALFREEDSPNPPARLRTRCRETTPAAGRPFGVRAPPVPPV